MSWYRRLGVAVGILGAQACGGPNSSAGPVVIVASESVQDQGSFVMVTIRNLSSKALRYSPCSYRIERPASEGSWRAVYEDTRPCLAALEFLDGYATRRVELSLPARLPAALYRIRFPAIGREGEEGEGFVAATQIGGEFSLGS